MQAGNAEALKKPSQDVGVGIDAPVSLTNAAPERFELTCAKASQTSDSTCSANTTTYDRTSATKARPHSEDSRIKVQSHKIVDPLINSNSCKSVNRSSGENEPTFPGNEAIHAEVITSTVSSSISLDSAPEKKAKEEARKLEDGVCCNENEKVQESTKPELHSSMKLKADQNSETCYLFPTKTRCQENVPEDLLPGATSKQEPDAYNDDDDDEDETGSLVELCLDKIDEASDESSQGSMEIHSEEDDDDGSTYDKRGFLSRESENHLPLGATCLTTAAANRNTARSKDSEECFPLSSSSKRKTASAAAAASLKNNLSKPCIVRKHLVHLDSALHPASSSFPPDSKPTTVDPERMDFLRQETNWTFAEKWDSTRDREKRMISSSSQLG